MANPNIITAREDGNAKAVTMKEGAPKLWWAARNPPADPAVSFVGKAVLVTGANTGLGFEAAVKYASKGASKLILGVRSVAKGEQAKREILHRSGRTDPSSIVILAVDLSDYDSVKRFAVALEAESPALDVALLNAGLVNPTFVRADTGWESAVQVNVLSSALMAVLLLPLLQRATATHPSEPAHLTFVNSQGHSEVEQSWLAASQGSLLRAADDGAAYEPRRSYAMVKLLGMAAALAVSRSPAAAGGRSVVVNSCCPYLTRTSLGRNFPRGIRLATGAFQALFARSAEEGSRTLVGATALGPESHGRFWHHDVLYPYGKLAQDEAFMEQTWSEILQVLVKVQPDVATRLEATP